VSLGKLEKAKISLEKITIDDYHDRCEARRVIEILNGLELTTVSFKNAITQIELDDRWRKRTLESVEWVLNWKPTGVSSYVEWLVDNVVEALNWMITDESDLNSVDKKVNEN